MKHVEFTLTVIGLVISVHIAGMYALSPLVGAITDYIGRFRMIAGGAITLMIAAVTAGTAPSHSSTQLGLGLFLLGVGWSMTLIAGSTLLAESIDVTHKTSAQGTSDLVMSSSGAIGGALAGVVIAVFGYFALCMSVLPLLVALLIASLRARD
jgi:MFS family permease